MRRKASVLPVPVRKPQLVRQVPFLVRMSRFPLQLDHHKLRYRRPSKKGETATSERWLPEHQRYRLWQGAPGDWLEYRRGKWQVLQKGRWRPLRTQEIPALQHVHLPRLSARPRYQLGQARAACAFPLRPETIPGGLEVAGHARLLFVRQRLYLQHLGQDGPGLQILPKRQAPRLLGRVRVYSGDLISVGQLTYRLHLDARGARLMLTRTPSSTPLMPFFQRYRSPQLTMRRTLIRGRKLLLTGGEGVAPGADRWRIHLSLAGEVGTTQLADPYRPFLLLAHRNDGTLQLSPQKDIPLYKAKPDGTFLSKQITSTQTIEPGPTLYYANRLYLRAF